MSGLRFGTGTKWLARTGKRARRPRPLTRVQEVLVLGMVFAIGVGLQLTLVLKLAPLVQ